MKNEMQWVVYILGCGDGSFYTGITNDMAARLEAHRQGKGAKYTKGRLPLTLIYKEECDNRSHASKREAAIKKLSKLEKMELVKRS